MANNNGNGQAIGWPAAVVAVALIVLVGAIIIVSILKYDTTEDALKIWTALTGIIGVLTGAVVTYFFTQGTINVVKEQQAKAEERAEAAQQELTAMAARVGR